LNFQLEKFPKLVIFVAAMPHFFQNNVLRTAFILGLCFGAAVCISASLGWWGPPCSIQTAQWVALGYLLLGLFFLLKRDPTLVLFCFTCSGAICLLLQSFDQF
jgi:hypothetical protein